MDITGMNELSQGNTMLHQMNEYNSGVKQHNLGIQSEFAQKIVDARTNLKNMGSEDGYSEKLTEKIGGGVGQGAVGLARDMNTAYKGLQSTQEGFNEMGKGGATRENLRADDGGCSDWQRGQGGSESGGKCL